MILLLVCSKLLSLYTALVLRILALIRRLKANILFFFFFFFQAEDGIRDYKVTGVQTCALQIPGAVKSVSGLESHVEDHDGAAGPTGQHHRAGFGDVARATRAINGEGDVEAVLEALRHHRKTPQAAARRAALRRPIPQPLDHPPGPLAVEVGAVHHHNAAATRPPHHRKDRTVPEREND